MPGIQTQGLCGETVTVQEFDSFSFDIQTLTTVTCLATGRADIFDAEHARRKGTYQLLTGRICPRCPRRLP